MIVCFPLFFIIPGRSKSESGREEKLKFSPKKFNFHQNAKSECLLFKEVLKPVGCLASPNTRDFARKKSPTGGEIQEL